MLDLNLYTWKKLADIAITNHRDEYCDFAVPTLEEKGVYILVIDDKVVYIGKTNNFNNRWNNGYCKAGLHSNKPSTNERINHAILIATFEGKPIELWWCKTNDMDELEEQLIRTHEPKLNIEFTSRDRRNV